MSPQANDFLIVLTSYKRPQNMNRLIDIFSAISEVRHKIVLLNANPEIDIRNWIATENWSKVEIINSKTQKFMLFRYEIAYRSSYNNFLLVDDDLFYNAAQINRLIKFYLDEPEIIHGGGFGQRVIYKNGIPELERCFPYRDGFIDVIGRIYCFSRGHINKLKALLDRLSIDFEYRKPGCDILLSFCNRPSLPKCHNLGNYQNCSTSATPGIAVYKTPGFHDLRNELVRSLLEHPNLKSHI